MDQADPGQDLVGLGADLLPGTLLAAYGAGVFPMTVGPSDVLGWWSPDPRGVLPLMSLRVSRSLRASCRRFEIRIDTAFDAVVSACADDRRPGAWIDDSLRRAYGQLFDAGVAHSVEAWREDRLVGGLFGLSIGGLFAGESMFHHERDASKVALVALVDRLNRDADPSADDRLLDVQWSTPHLASLGVIEVSRQDYLAHLERALSVPGPHWDG